MRITSLKNDLVIRKEKSVLRIKDGAIQVIHPFIASDKATEFATQWAKSLGIAVWNELPDGRVKPLKVTK